MEEIRSTEVLDREILEDAARKAAKIRSDAEERLVVMASERDKRLWEAVSAENSRLERLAGIASGEAKAAVALEKMRIHLRKEAGLLDQAMAAYFASLPRKAILALLRTELQERAASLAEESGGSVICEGLSLDEAAAVCAGLLPQANWQFSAVKEASLPALTVETANVRVYASLKERAAALELEKREELLTSALSSAA